MEGNKWKEAIHLSAVIGLKAKVGKAGDMYMYDDVLLDTAETRELFY